MDTKFDEEQWYSLVDFVAVFNNEISDLPLRTALRSKCNKFPCGEYDTGDILLDALAEINPRYYRGNKESFRK